MKNAEETQKQTEKMEKKKTPKKTKTRSKTELNTKKRKIKTHQKFKNHKDRILLTLKNAEKFLFLFEKSRDSPKIRARAIPR